LALIFECFLIIGGWIIWRKRNFLRTIIINLTLNQWRLLSRFYLVLI
jgi:hypothetical protein